MRFGPVPLTQAAGNVIGWVLPRLLAGDHLTRADVIARGHGGLLEDAPERPMPRNNLA